ncbi:MAG: hypothetical protein HY425_03260 [Candidatus Levybacteria bacterium]|nr:hypothetical protein [Candidatus Levybacteria bacterium]
MSEANAGAEFLQKKYQLNTDYGVKAAAKRNEQRTGETVDQGDFSTRIQNYLNRLHAFVNPPELTGSHSDFDRKGRNLTMAKHALHRNFVTSPENIPESYYDSIKRRHREEGYGEINIPDDYRRELAQAIIKDQQGSLDGWVDYLASDEAKYPDWLKYFAFRSVLGMGNYDKSKGVFNERTKGGKTVAPFPELNREALAIVLGDLEQKYPDEKARADKTRTDFEFTGRFDISQDSKQKYLEALENKNFSQLYGLAIEEFKPIAEELLKITKGKWVKYPRGSDPKRLVDSLSSYGTGWCIRGEAMAERYLVRDKNDLHVFYSFDQEGNPVVPRVVMVINQQGNIAEVRGVARDEHLDSYIGDVVDAKLSEPEFEEEGKSYKKKSSDMRLLTDIERKIKKGEKLNSVDLTFFYELNSQIEGFGYKKDPRIAELRLPRNREEDMLVIFACEKSQIAHDVKEINKDTKAYVGPLAPGIFDLLSKYNIEHIYTSFPEGKIRIESLEIGGKSKSQLEQELKQANINITEYAKDMLNSKDFIILPNPKMLPTVRLKVADLLLGNPTTDQIYAKAKELGLDLVPAEAGVHFRLKYKDQPLNEWLYMGMKQIADRHGRPDVFRLDRGDDGLWLGHGWAGPGDGWDPEDALMFSLSPPSHKATEGQGKSEPQKLGFLDRFLKH